MATHNLWDGIPSALVTGDILNYPNRSSDGRKNQTLKIRLTKGIYKLEAWGCASGVDTPGTPGTFTFGGCTGGYSVGTLTLNSAVDAYLNPGGVGANGGNYTIPSSGQYRWAGSGGGSDIRLLANGLYNRVIVAGGGGRGGNGIIYRHEGEMGEQLVPVGATSFLGGYGGGTSGEDAATTYTGPEIPWPVGTDLSPYAGKGGSQTQGGATGTGYNTTSHFKQDGIFGEGGWWSSNYSVKTGIGGGGWYGGGGGGQAFLYYGDYVAECELGGAGGSGFVWSAATASGAPSGYALGSAYYLTDAMTSSGHDGTPIPEPDGTTAEGHNGEGYIRITVIRGQLPSPTVTSVSYPTEGTVRIAFNSVANAEAYKVYDGSGHLLATISGSPYTETGISDDTAYTRKIAAWSSEYAESEPTTVNYTSQGKLDTPTNLRATYTANSTTIRWNAVSGATSYAITKNGTPAGTVSGTSFTDTGASAGRGYTYTVTAKANGRWDSDPASITTGNKPQLPNVGNLRASQTVSSVTLTWDPVTNATGYDIYRDGTKIGSTTGTSYTDNTTQPGKTYQYKVVAKASGYYDSTGASVNVGTNPQLETPTLIEASQTRSSTKLNWDLRSYGATATFTLKRDGVEIYRGAAKTYTDTGLTEGQTYVYTLTASIPGSGYYDSKAAVLYVLIGRDYTTIERQKDYLASLRRPFTKLCRLRFLNPNGTTAFALDNNPRNKRSHTFIANGSVSGNLQNGQRLSATVTLYNADLEYETAVNKVWFGQEIALDEGLVLSNGTEYYRQTGVFLIDNPQEKIDPKNNTVTYRLLDKWAALDGTLGGNLEGTYEVPVGTNIFEPITSLLTEDRGNGLPLDAVPPVYTEYYNDKTQELTDGTTASMTDSPYTLTVNGDGGTKAQVLLGLAGMVNAWIGYDNTGRLRVDPSQDDILDTDKPVLWRFTPEEAQLLGLAYTVKKEDVYNDYIVVGEMLDDYTQPGGRATNYDPRSDTNVNIIGRKTKYESASGYATSTQCRDLAEWKLKRSSILQRAVSISCIQMMHIDLNSLVEVVRTDKPGSPVERHLIQGFTRPLAYNGAMTITAVSVQDLPIATVTEWPERESTAFLTFRGSGTITLGLQKQTPYWNGRMEYKIEGTDWQEWTGATVTSGEDHCIYLRGLGNTVVSGNSGTVGSSNPFVLTGRGIQCIGNIETILDYKAVDAGEHPEMDDNCFYSLFNSNASLVSAPELPATDIASSTYCYSYMFAVCTALTAPPSLPAERLSPSCYEGMFRGCSSLSALPLLPAKALPSRCYVDMFRNCGLIKLSTTQDATYTTPYDIPSGGSVASSVVGYCKDMFTGTGGSFSGSPDDTLAVNHFYTSDSVVQSE